MLSNHALTRYLHEIVTFSARVHVHVEINLPYYSNRSDEGNTKHKLIQIKHVAIGQGFHTFISNRKQYNTNH